MLNPYIVENLHDPVPSLLAIVGCSIPSPARAIKSLVGKSKPRPLKDNRLLAVLVPFPRARARCLARFVIFVG